MSRLVLVLAVVAAFASDARAWAPIDPSMPRWSGTVPYSMNTAGSADLGAMSADIVQTAMGDWTRVSCTSLRSSYMGTTGATPGSGDGVSVIGWHESSWGYDSNAIGVTGPRWSRSIVEADMELNGVNYTWISGSGFGSRVNAYSIILHEGGHYYGLGHSSDSSATMYFAYSGGISTLNADDRNGICALYPGGTSDCTTTGCPAGQVCTGGMCVTMMGDGGTCSPCSGGGDCTDGACLVYPGGAGNFCGDNCSGAGGCGVGEMCVTVSSGRNQCVRFRGTTPSCAAAPAGCTSDSDCSTTQRCNTATGACEARPMTGAELGGECGAAADCRSGLCFAGHCSQSCDWLSPTSCPAGFYCSGEAAGGCSTGGLCVTGSPGGGAAGAACSSATDCASAYCASGVCTTPCIPGGATGCPEGYSCAVGAAAGCGSCQRSGTLGDPCETGDDCTERTCAEIVAGEGFCTVRCDVDAPCPSGFSCLDAGGGVRVCAPDSGPLGTSCTDNPDCLSGICASEGDHAYCTRLCDRRTNPCPGSFECIATDDPAVRVCRPDSNGSCGCAAPGTGGRGGVPLALAVFALVWIRRRRN